ncbi:MAG TPA: ribosome maturation factor RimP [Calditrichia bacterium]|nr:ribosome maturation factor RimP [Calditrichota bacterium]HQU71260.1 ribosome maturation factor RimP [Calditrichia bacterium]HQV32693.1 ribosome maturation factor RimP [Calditrichia bacterium]
MSPLEIRIRELIQPLFDEESLHLVDVEVRGTAGSQVLNVFADTNAGITLAEITRLTREINDLLDIYDVIPGNYRLEVSSPGIRRSLEHLWEFRKNISRKLKVIYEEDAEQRELTGELIAAEDDFITLKVDKKEHQVPRPAIRRALVQLKW